MRLPRALLLLPLLAACAAPVPQGVTARHFASTESAGDGARWHIFVFDPSATRDLDTRIALARANLRSGCRWVGAPRSEIEARTAEQGARYEGSVLAAPVSCQG